MEGQAVHIVAPAKPRQHGMAALAIVRLRENAHTGPQKPETRFGVLSMRQLTLITLSLLGCAARAAPIKEEDGVLVLNKRNW